MSKPIIRTLSPKTFKELRKFRSSTGVFVIRLEKKVLYIGFATDLYRTISRYYLSDRALSKYQAARCNFEVIICDKRNSKFMAGILKRVLNPLHNVPAMPLRLNRNNRKKKGLLLKQYYEDSFFARMEGDHQTDNNLSLTTKKEEKNERSTAGSDTAGRNKTT